MKSELKNRILKIANNASLLRYYSELVRDMAMLSDAWNASSSRIKEGLEARDSNKLSLAILDNRKQAKQMSDALERYERILAKLGE